eukprot:CAMPEP_0171242328 /NCGR_PEP_ID=MMETSP0790-20130122/45625_1 /TAXON_ID=2925 /ORGANISM="Alexandrium catenella, Strain OF101" /LENGTH=102 /DNA_ID=CAMNT_0011709107 /DNA_START=29 /DNA_END=333 /DNA_ORIENTATION=+
MPDPLPTQKHLCTGALRSFDLNKAVEEYRLDLEQALHSSLTNRKPPALSREYMFPMGSMCRFEGIKPPKEPGARTPAKLSRSKSAPLTDSDVNAMIKEKNGG